MPPQTTEGNMSRNDRKHIEYCISVLQNQLKYRDDCMRNGEHYDATDVASAIGACAAILRDLECVNEPLRNV